MRGALGPVLKGIRSWRIIPADAGSTELLSTYDVADKDHPRGCGEHFFSRSPWTLVPGSSPRMRGAHDMSPIDSWITGIIPADAGSTQYHDTTCPKARDHPRGCGEHFSAANRDWLKVGSSPRRRGAQTYRRLIPNQPRIIPADAGSTLLRPCPKRPARDHPRGCGEHCFMYSMTVFILGSSPRMRGALRMKPEFVRMVRIIPADAGSTSSSRTRRPSPEDHPRGCGEHQAFMLSGLSFQGSSPRMRGARGGR